MTSHRNFLTNNENCFRVLDTPRAELAGLSTLVSVPLFHVTGCNSQLLPMLEWGGRIEILSGPLDLDGFFAAVGEHGVNQLVSVPAIYHAVTRHPKFAELDVSGVRWVSYGGAPIAESLVQRIKEAFPNARVGNGFGLTETSSLSTFLPHEEAAEHADSVGFATPVVDLAIDAPDADTGVGELLVRGANVVQGYWNKPDATAETFVDGWLHTGDLARIDADGLLYIVDRKKDMINRGGENVYCIEVENALAGAPGVGEAAAVGVPDEMMGEKVGAAIVPAPGAELDVAAVIAHCRAQPRRLQGPAVRRRAVAAAAAQPRRQGAQGAAARRDRLGPAASLDHANGRGWDVRGADRAGRSRRERAGADARARAPALSRRGRRRAVARAL